MLRITTIFVFYCLGLTCMEAQQASNQDFKLPSIGRWLEKQDGTPANWLGKKFQKKELIEPINVVIIDPYAKSKEEAVKKLKDTCRKFGYKEKIGHSSGYCATIDSIRLTQFNGKKALANRSFFKTNNHGRIMGPELIDNEYVFIGAFSREAFQPFTKAHHAYRSFLIARNDFCHKLNQSKTYSVRGTYFLDNRVNAGGLTTGDHDGEAIVISATR